MSAAPPIRPSRVLAWSAAVGVLLVALAVFPTAITVILVAFAGIILGVYLRGITNILARRVPIPRVVLLMIVVLVHLGALTLFAMWAVPAISEQLEQVTDDVVRAWDDLRELLASTWIGALAGALPSPERILTDYPALRDEVVGMFGNAIFGLIAFAIIIFVGLYLAWAPASYLTGILVLVPPERRTRVGEILHELYITLGRWVTGRTISAAIIGVLTGLGEWAIGVPLPFALAVLAGLLTYIPNIGPILTLVPASLLGLTQGWTVALGAVGVYLGVQFVESYLLTPLVERWAVRIPPALLLVVQALFGVLMGLLGVALAAPITAVLMVLTRRLYVEDRLGDEEADAEEARHVAEHGTADQAPEPA